jgi:hypothetical protein
MPYLLRNGITHRPDRLWLDIAHEPARVERAATATGLEDRMRRGTKLAVLALGALGAFGWMPARARGQVASDLAAAIIVLPRLQFIISGQTRTDTLIQLSNTSRTEPVDAQCFYVSAGLHCSNTGLPCQGPSDCQSGSCIQGWVTTDFFVRVTQGQPLGWLLSGGLGRNGRPLPLDGTIRSGPRDPNDPTGRTSQSNAGTLVPSAVAPFRGELKCITIDRNRRPIAKNLLVGHATTTRINPATGEYDVEKYNAIGLRARPGTNDGDSSLVLDSETGEYEGCPNTLIVNHFFDFARSPINSRRITSTLTFVPCSEDLRTGDPRFGSAVAQFLVFNEFEQRFSASLSVLCYLETDISKIDTTQPQRSIFSVGVAGTLVGQTRVRPVQRGLIAVLRERHSATGGSPTASAMVNVHQQGTRGTSDEIRLP